MVNCTENGKSDPIVMALHQQYQVSKKVETAIDSVSKELLISKRIVEAKACEIGYIPSKYQRNIGTLGQEGQAKLLRTKVLLVGLGGLGGHVAEQMARAGIGIIVGVDFDVFEESNLNRQRFANHGSLGFAKAKITREEISKINEAVEMEDYNIHFEQLSESVYSDCHLFFDCLDNIPMRLFLEKKAIQFSIPLIHGAVGGWYGQVATLHSRQSILSKIYAPELKHGIEEKLGNPPFTVAFIASLMVCEGIKLVCAQTPPKNCLIFVDLLHQQFQRIPLTEQ